MCKSWIRHWACGGIDMVNWGRGCGSLVKGCIARLELLFSRSSPGFIMIIHNFHHLVFQVKWEFHKKALPLAPIVSTSFRVHGTAGRILGFSSCSCTSNTASGVETRVAQSSTLRYLIFDMGPFRRPCSTSPLSGVFSCYELVPASTLLLDLHSSGVYGDLAGVVLPGMTGEALSSLDTRTALLRARVTSPADPEPVRLARDFLHGLMRQGPKMDVFDLVRRAREAHGALTRPFTCSTLALDHTLELIDDVELQARRVNNAEAQSAAQERVRQALDNQMVALLAQLEDMEILEAALENLSTFYAEGAEARVQVAKESQEALDSATAAADEAQAQADAKELALEGFLLDLYRASRMV
ncbi:hypothetical protein ACLB2K_023019 [Fragaria x ananassa]